MRSSAVIGIEDQAECIDLLGIGLPLGEERVGIFAALARGLRDRHLAGPDCVPVGLHFLRRVDHRPTGRGPPDRDAFDVLADHDQRIDHPRGDRLTELRNEHRPLPRRKRPLIFEPTHAAGREVHVRQVAGQRLVRNAKACRDGAQRHLGIVGISPDRYFDVVRT